MAGGGTLGAGGGKTKRGSSKRKKSKRVGFTLDMTPLVDITFLLLTFFMFTTTMAAPQALDMSIPPEIDVQIDVRESELLSIFVREDNKIFWAKGSDDPQRITQKDTNDLSFIRDLSFRENLDPAVRNKLIVALKTSKDAQYGIIVRILDQLNLAEGLITGVLSKNQDPKFKQLLVSYKLLTSAIEKELSAGGDPETRERRFTIAILTDEEIEKLQGTE